MEVTCAGRVSGAGAGALDGMASAAREARVSGLLTAAKGWLDGQCKPQVPAAPLPPPLGNRTQAGNPGGATAPSLSTRTQKAQSGAAVPRRTWGLHGMRGKSGGRWRDAAAPPARASSQCPSCASFRHALFAPAHSRARRLSSTAWRGTRRPSLPTRDVEVEVAVAQVSIARHPDGRPIRAAAVAAAPVGGCRCCCSCCCLLGEGGCQAVLHVLN